MKGRIQLLFFLSGATGLVYEILWTRRFGLLFGNTTAAVSAVLAAFFGGLALGAALLGRRTDAHPRPLRVYGLLEIGAGISALLVPLLVGLATPLYVNAARGIEGGFALSGVRLLTAFLLLAIPTLCLGGTLPVLSRFLATGAAGTAPVVGSLYGANTAGAMAGTVLTSFVGVRLLGVTGWGLIAVALNLAVGVTALLLDRRIAARSSAKAADRPGTRPAGEGASGAGTVRQGTSADSAGTHERDRGRLTLAPGTIAALATGFATLGLEVAWTRGLTSFLGGTTYAFSTMLFAILFGIVLGSALFTFLARHGRAPGARGLGTFLLLGAVSSYAFLFVLGAAIPWVEAAGRSTWAVWAGARFLVAVVSLLPPSLVLGAVLPAALALAAERRGFVGRGVGSIYAVNTVAGILGSIVSGFLLLPRLGVDRTLLVFSWFLAAAGLWLLVVAPDARGRKRAGPALARLLPALLVLGPIAFTLIPGDRFRTLFVSRRPGALLYYREGVSGVVSVFEESNPGAEPYRKLYINGTPNSGTHFFGRRYMRLQSHLPLLLAPDPSKALVLCFGTGMTLGAAAAHDSVRRADCAELSSTVLDAAPLFRAENGNVLEDPKVQVHVNDGRNFLLAANERWDVITAEPPPPTDAGVVNLYSRDFYRICREHLSPGGILGQWIPFYNQDESDSKGLLRALLDAFPEVTLWSTDRLDTFAMASDRPLRIDYARLEQRMSAPSLAAGLQAIGVTGAPSLLATFLMDRGAIERYVAGTAPITDDRPRIEFFLPVDLRQRIPSAADLPDLFERVLNARSADADLARILDVAPARKAAVLDSVLSYRAAMVDCYEAEIARGRGLAWRSGSLHEAAVTRDPSNNYFLFFLGADDVTLELARAAGGAAGENPTAVAAIAYLRVLRHEYGEAEALARRVVEEVPSAADGQYLLGRALEGKGDYAGAKTAFEKALGLNPKHAASRLALGILRIDHLDDREAGAEDLREAARLDPNLGPAADEALVRARGR